MQQPAPEQSFFQDPVIDLSTCRLTSQGAEAVGCPSETVKRLLENSRRTKAEALLLPQRIWEGEYLGRPTIIKQRFSKKYRHAALDSKLTLGRLKQARPTPPHPCTQHDPPCLLIRPLHAEGDRMHMTRQEGIVMQPPSTARSLLISEQLTCKTSRGGLS